MTARSADEKGFVLLVVLWTVALLGLFSGQLVSRSRGEASLASNARDTAVLGAAADGGINAGIFRLLSREWVADSAPRQSSIGQVALVTTVENEAGRINPNASSLVLLTSLIHVLGVAQGNALDLATAMLQWRTRAEEMLPLYRRAGLPYGPTGMPFQSIDEIGLVLGMTPELLALMRPHLSLFQEGEPDIALADPVVRQSLDGAASRKASPRTRRGRPEIFLVRITVVARLGGRRSVRSAEIRIPAQPAEGEADYTLLSWEGE